MFHSDSCAMLNIRNCTLVLSCSRVCSSCRTSKRRVYILPLDSFVMQSMAASLLQPSSPCSVKIHATDFHRRISSSRRNILVRLSSPPSLPGIIRSSGSVFARAFSVPSSLHLSLNPRRFEFDGLKMSSTEGLAKRTRDPQILANETADAVRKSRSYVRSQMSKPGVFSLLVAVAIPLFLGSIDGFVNSPNSQWYTDLKKPWWQPPGPIFGGAWGILYPLMGFASWLVWAQGGVQKHGQALGLYALQLFLNLLWPKLFFGSKNLGLALVDISALAVVLALTIKAFKSVNYVAANVMIPYLVWVLFATALNINLWLNNRGSPVGQTAQ